ncbi:rRNA maturation RNase YbeY [Streptococcus pantholopis]|uniref:Endoribonuclease YbeY n=1 Tax=Streptococcus pantholopis TaxID=1811193 RepID=A0A172Q633_9STRE|nr:rRNA maturation RNase YbeY [Streptococcus pantholopis]AND78929.1 rRNA maturation RNase YbeY [Streptococcus pantholopis]
MYIEMVDETGQVSQEMMAQTLDLLNFAAEKIGKENKEMAVTFVTNERSRQLNVKYRETDRPTDVISLEYKPDRPAALGSTSAKENAELADLLEELNAYIGELFISVDKAHEQAAEYGHSFEREMGFLAVHGFLHINGYDHYTPEEEKAMFTLQEEILTAYGLTR